MFKKYELTLDLLKKKYNEKYQPPTPIHTLFTSSLRIIRMKIILELHRKI